MCEVELAVSAYKELEASEQKLNASLNLIREEKYKLMLIIRKQPNWVLLLHPEMKH